MKFEIGETYITKDGSRAKIKIITAYAMIGIVRKAEDSEGIKPIQAIWLSTGYHGMNPRYDLVMKESDWQKNLSKYPDERIQKALNRAIINCELPDNKRQMLIDEFWAIIKNLQTLEQAEKTQDFMVGQRTEI